MTDPIQLLLVFAIVVLSVVLLLPQWRSRAEAEDDAQEEAEELRVTALTLAGGLGPSSVSDLVTQAATIEAFIVKGAAPQGAALQVIARNARRQT